MKQEKEIWRDVKDYEGYYQVSNLGRVKSLARVVIGSNGISQKVKLKILKLVLNIQGYPSVSLCRGKQSIKKVHQISAIAFLGHVPKGNKIVVDHIDNNKSNNRLDNLQIVTARENNSKDKKRGTSKYIGVVWNKIEEKWVSRISINGKNKSLGYFIKEIEAAKAYQTALKELVC